MQLDVFDYYLIAINSLGIILYLINWWLYSHTERAQIDILLTICCLAGGAIGIIIAILCVDRKPGKENMLSRVVVACTFVLQLILVLIAKGVINNRASLAFWDYFENHKLLIWYLIAVNIVAIIAFGIDKIAAVERKGRIKIVTLLGIAFIGGAVGALIAMYSFRHKTKQPYFQIGVPLILVTHIVVLFFVMNIA